MRTSLNPSNFKGILITVLDYPLVKGVLTSTALAYNWVFSENATYIYVVAALLALDTITGVWRSWKNKIVWSKGFFRVAAKSAVYFILLATGALVDKVMPATFAFTMMTVFLACTEAISIMENVSQLGLPIPIKLVEILKVMKDEAPKKRSK